MKTQIRCTRCKKYYESKYVSVWKQTNKPQYESLCRLCINEKARKYRLTKKGREAVNLASKRAYQKHKIKWLARAKVRYAVKKGDIIKPNKCEKCNKKLLLQAHHEDYSKPLDVIWLCFGCHADADKLLENNLTLPSKHIN